MANTKIIFYGSEKSQTIENELECYHNIHNEIYIKIQGDQFEHIVLDIPTAIKLSKVLRTEINKAKEATNG